MAKAHPEPFGPRGTAFHDAVTGELELEAHEAALLAECCRTLDRLDALHAAGLQVGPLTPDARVQPWLIEARQQQLTLARLIASIRLPDEYTAVHLDRGQRRGASRGTYVTKAKLEVMKNAQAK